MGDWLASEKILFYWKIMIYINKYVRVFGTIF